MYGKRRRGGAVHMAVYVVVELCCQLRAGHGFVPGYGCTRSRPGIGSIRVENLPQTGPGAVQTGLDRADWNTRNLMNFLKFISFAVVQEEHEAVLVTEDGKCSIEPHYVIQPLRITYRIEVSRQRFHALARELTLLDGHQAGPCKASPIVDEVVVHDPAQPGARLRYRKQIIESSECLEQDILEQVFRLRLRAGEATGEAVQPVKMRPQQSVKTRALVLLNGTHAGGV
jgi:hypothetical protein